MRFGRGQSAVELAIALPALAVMLAVASDFARAFYVAITLNGAARAGAQYGSESLITAADSNGMQSAAALDATNISGMATTASQCTCQSGTSVPGCASSYCTNNPGATYVLVNTQATFNTIIHYPGIPSSLTLAGHAIMQVQQ